MIYLDNAATSWPKPPQVLQAAAEALRDGGNAGRGGHGMSLRAADELYACRESLARLFHVDNPLRINFTLNATMAINQALKGWLQPGDHVVCTAMEHNAVWRPLTALQEIGVEHSIAAADAEGFVTAEAIAAKIRPDTRLIVAIHASNVCGAINDVTAIGQLARQRNIAFMVDASQSAGAVPIDVEAMSIDLLAFPGHKSLMGPQGVGGLFVRPSCELEPLLQGGTGSDSRSPQQPLYAPDRYESGTMNGPGVAGLRAGVDWVLQEGVDAIGASERALTSMLIDGLRSMRGVEVFAPKDEARRTAVASFRIEGVDSVRAGDVLFNEFGIACRAGLHCAGLAHQSLGTLETGLIRFSPGAFTTQDEITSALEAVRNIAARR